MAMQARLYPVDPYPVLSLYYWKAVSAFGQKAVQLTVESPEFAQTYPHLLAQLQSGDIRTRSHTLLPEETIRRIASRPECIYDFWEAPEGDRITRDAADATPAGTRRDEGRTKGWLKLDRQDALNTYGAHALFLTVDSGVGYKQQHDDYVDLHREREALRLSVTATKASFVLPEPVLITIALTNTGEFPIQIIRRLVLSHPDAFPGVRDLRFYLLSPGGTELCLPTREGIDPGSYQEYSDMEPGETITETFDLLSFYRIEEPGRYKFRASHSQASDYSNWIEFDIHAP